MNNEETPLPIEETVLGYFQLDTNNKVLAWGSSSFGDENEVEIVLAMDHPLVTMQAACENYKYVDGELVYCEDQQLANAKADIALLLDTVCNHKILEGFSYIIDVDNVSTTYHVSYSESRQALFNETYSSFMLNSIETVDWYLTDEEGMEVAVTLDKLAFVTLYMYSNIIKQQKIDKLKLKLLPLLETITSLHEAQLFDWDAIPDDPLPEKPKVDLDSTVSKAEFDEIVKQNEKLEQQFRQNQNAIAELVNLVFSTMNGFK